MALIGLAESKMGNLHEKPNLSQSISRFNNIFTLVATIHAGKSKPSKKSKPWMTPRMQAKIRTCNHLCRTIHQNRQ